MIRFLLALAALLTLTLPHTSRADPADINAASRGVVRVVIMGKLGDEVYPISHGTGFAVAPNRIVTNAHVVREAALNEELQIGIVPSGGGGPTLATLVAVSPRNDLALLQIKGSLRLPQLSISGMAAGDNGEVTAVGYPMNVDRAQGLSIDDIFSSQPPVKSRGALAGARPSRDFDTILHTAPIAAGNSGGPLLDPCGRVVGINSFGADSAGSDAEFFFAVSMRELLPFLKANGVSAQINGEPCRSLADLDAEERERIEREQDAEQARIAAHNATHRQQLDKARDQAELEVQEEREDAMMLSFIALLIAAGAAFFAWQAQIWARVQTALYYHTYPVEHDDADVADEAGVIEDEGNEVGGNEGSADSIAKQASSEAESKTEGQLSDNSEDEDKGDEGEDESADDDGAEDENTADDGANGSIDDDSITIESPDFGNADIENADIQAADAQHAPRARITKRAAIATVIALAALVAAAVLWLTRPGIDAVERKISASMSEFDSPESGIKPAQTAAFTGALACTLDPSRSRITGSPAREVELSWQEDGCVNTRTQYGFASGDWSRVLVPNQEAAVSVNSYDPVSATFRTERYLLPLSAMKKARAARGKYKAPQCGSERAAAKLGDLQGAILSQLPDHPNERLVYKCEAKK